MSTRTRLRDLVDAMQFQSQESDAFLDKKTGSIVVITDELRLMMEQEGELDHAPEWQREMIQDARAIENDTEGRFILLPSQEEIHEYGIMEDFIDTLSSGPQIDTLQRAIQGRGAFRRFKDTLLRFGIAESWYRFRDEAMGQIALAWCEEHGIPVEKS